MKILRITKMNTSLIKIKTVQLTRCQYLPLALIFHMWVSVPRSHLLAHFRVFEKAI